MKMKKIKGVLIDVENEKVEVIEIEKSLESYYKILNCDTIDIATRMIDGIPFDIICDDEGLLKEIPKVSAIDTEYRPALFGNLFVVKYDGEEDVTSLTDDEINHILNNCKYLHDTVKMQSYQLLTGIEF